MSLSERQVFVLRAALYVLADGSPPDWYQIEIQAGFQSLARHGEHEIEHGVKVERVAHAPEVSLKIIGSR